MERCDGHSGRGSEGPLFIRVTQCEGEPVRLRLCAACKAQSDEELRRKIRLWLPPYDQRMMGVGA